jgi:hypothetical protein
VLGAYRFTSQLRTADVSWYRSETQSVPSASRTPSERNPAIAFSACFCPLREPGPNLAKVSLNRIRSGPCQCPRCP